MGERRIDLDAPPRPARSARRTRRRRWDRVLLVGCLVALPLGVHAFHQWWVSPERLLRRFVAAVQRRDAHAIMACVDPEELRRLGLTPEETLGLLDGATGSVGRLVVGDVRDEPLNDYQSRFNRLATVALYDRAGRPLSGRGGMPARAAIWAYRTPRGWRVGLSEFVRLVVLARVYAGDRVRYTTLCDRYGMPHEYFQPVSGEWEKVRGFVRRR